MDSLSLGQRRGGDNCLPCAFSVNTSTKGGTIARSEKNSWTHFRRCVGGSASVFLRGRYFTRMGVVSRFVPVYTRKCRNSDVFLMRSRILARNGGEHRWVYQVSQGHTKGLSQMPHIVDRDISHPPLYLAYVGPTQICSQCQVFLRNIFQPASTSQILAENLARR